MKKDPLYYRPAYKQNLIHLIHSSIGLKIFQTYWAKNCDGKLIDVCGGGIRACSVVTSSITVWVGLSRRICYTVDAFIKDILSFGWYPVDLNELKPGAVLVWEPKIAPSDGKKHRHVGFFLGGDKVGRRCASNQFDGVVPVYHDLTYDGAREVENAYCHPFLLE